MKHSQDKRRRHRRYALSLHDVRVSGDDETVLKIEKVLDRYRVPLAVHLVFDEMLDEGSRLARFLRKKMDEGLIEVVFHGLSHLCPETTGRLTSFYHKHQAEYLLDTEKLRDETREVYGHVREFTGRDAGICPPCWIACRNNRIFLRKLNPVFVESLLSMDFSGRKFFSPVISLGSPVKKELIFLKAGARLMHLVALLLPGTRLRIAVHECDLEIPQSLDFFAKRIELLDKKGFRPVLMSGLL